MEMLYLQQRVAEVRRQRVEDGGGGCVSQKLFQMNDHDDWHKQNRLVYQTHLTHSVVVKLSVPMFVSIPAVSLGDTAKSLGAAAAASEPTASLSSATVKAARVSEGLVSPQPQSTASLER
jgi:hypothetical protein